MSFDTVPVAAPPKLLHVKIIRVVQILETGSQNHIRKTVLIRVKLAPLLPYLIQLIAPADTQTVVQVR